jgi:pyridoxal phosphate enzyme (YggS family)
VVDIAENVRRIRERVDAAASRVGREPDEIVLVAASKRQPASAVIAAATAGINDFGENYVQEGARKRSEVEQTAQGKAWHLIGHLQTNKANAAVDSFDLIQTVDSARLARLLDEAAAQLGKVQPVLVQVRLGDEPTKTGAPAVEIDAVMDAVLGASHLRLRGLMGIAPVGADGRPYYAWLRERFEKLSPEHRAILSMGMSDDFEAAIEMGATLVRVGTAIFGPRPSLDQR